MERQEIFNGIKEILNYNFEIEKVNFTEETLNQSYQLYKNGKL